MTTKPFSRLGNPAVRIPLAAIALVLGAGIAPAVAQPLEVGGGAVDAATPEMRWQVSLADQQREIWGVSLELHGLDLLREQGRLGEAGVTFHMPNWTPGVYERDVLGANVSGFSARCLEEGREYPVEREHDDTWQVRFETEEGKAREAPAALAVSYRTPARARFTRGRLGLNYAYFTGTAMYVYLRDVLDLPSTVTFTDVPEDWQLHTQLRHDEHEPYTVHAVDYDELVDSPTVLGPFGTASFEVDGATIEIVVAAPQQHIEPTREALIEPVRRICEVAAEMFGGLPFERYTFLYFLRPAGFGGRGLEHTNSTQIWSSVQGVLNERRRHTVLFITAHEFFHLWNVKRIRAEPLRPYDYSRVPELDCLWFHEGVTSYYTDVYLKRAGLMSEERFRRRMEHLLGILNHTDDYYDQGEAWGFLLDLLIRHHSNNRNSLDDLFRIMWHHYGKTERGFNQTDAVARIASGLAGVDLSWFTERYILGDRDTPVSALLAGMGYRFRSRGPQPEQPYWGLYTESDKEGAARIEWVMPLGPAAQAGLKPGDRLLKLEGQELCAQRWPVLREQVQPDEQATLTVRRGERDKQLTVVVGSHLPRRGQLTMAEPQGNELQNVIYRGILEGTHPRPQAAPQQEEEDAPEEEDEEEQQQHEGDNKEPRRSPQEDDEDF